MKIDGVWFREDVRVHGNIFLRGVMMPDDSKKWELRADQDGRVVLLKAKNDSRIPEGSIFVVPWENVSCMRLAPADPVAAVAELANHGLISRDEAPALLEKAKLKKA